MGIFDSKEDQSRELARQLANSLASLTGELSRLQEQQRSDERRWDVIEAEVKEIEDALTRLDRGQAIMEEVLAQHLARIQYLETNLSCDLGDRFVSIKEFKSYKESLRNQEIDRREKSLSEQKKRRRQVGIAIGGALTALAPQIYKIVAWIVDRVLHH